MVIYDLYMYSVVMATSAFLKCLCEESEGWSDFMAHELLWSISGFLTKNYFRSKFYLKIAQYLFPYHGITVLQVHAKVL